MTAHRHIVAFVLAASAGAALLSGCTNPNVIPPGDTAAQMARASALADEAQAAERRGQPEKAVDLYRQSILAYEEFYPAWNNLGVLLMERDMYQQAAEAFKRASELAPLDPRPPTSLGLIYKARGHDAQAMEYFAQAVERDDSYLPALRESVRLDVLTEKITERTGRNVSKALLLEKDGKWLTQLRRYKLQIDERLRSQNDPMVP